MITNVIAGVFIIGLIYMLVRPGSPTVTAITSTTNVLANLIHAAVRGVE